MNHKAHKVLKYKEHEGGNKESEINNKEVEKILNIQQAIFNTHSNSSVQYSFPSVVKNIEQGTRND